MGDTTVPDKPDQAGIYDGYEAWKGWRGSFRYDARKADLFAGDLSGIALDGKTVLELAFGDGQLLAWSRDQGATVLGTEVSETLLEAGREAGFEVHGPNLKALLATYEGRVDRIIAFDIFEHFDLAELIATFECMRDLLAPEGLIIAKFPNGQSPFGLYFQNGDITHKSILSIPIIRQLGNLTGFEVLRAGNSYRARSPNPIKRAIQALRYLARDAISFLIAAVFAVDTRHHDGNVTVVLRRRGEARE